MDWDTGNIYASNQYLSDVSKDNNVPGNDRLQLTVSMGRRKFRDFVRNFRSGNRFIYRETLLQNYRKSIYCLEVSLNDLNSYDVDLEEALRMQPSKFTGEFEKALEEVVLELTLKSPGSIVTPQLLLKSQQRAVNMRDLTATDINRLLNISGIVISAGRSTAKARSVNLKCRSCGHLFPISCPEPFQGAIIPRQCQSKSASNASIDDSISGEKSCGLDSYAIIPEKCGYIDQQTLKLQEAPEQVPTGEMPRHVLLAVDRYLVDKVTPGTRVSVVGTYSIFKSSKGGAKNGANSSGRAVRTPYFKVIGMSVASDGSGVGFTNFSAEDEEKYQHLARGSRIYNKIWQSICPSISGDYTIDLKKAIACLLFGGSRKILPDGMALRGDINILLLGDPSTAKSQFLKFVEKVAPVGVYTSGKGSSAAGLTASVIRDSRGEFYLEGGAMVLSDGGVCCIDEFDKMRETDRVAIHEAMEQQTISVAKAGITTILNSRSSVLAAANPVFGSYDDSKTAAENIDFLPTILSRFDLIFIVRDIRNETKDRKIAEHVMGVHINSEEFFEKHKNSVSGIENELSLLTMKRFISYCRNRRAPSLSLMASKLLQSHYIQIRETQRRRNLEVGTDEASVPITVRQLEAIVRISESLAKMSLSMYVNKDHVTEAIRLFKVSTGLASLGGGGDILQPNMTSNVQVTESLIQRRVALGSDILGSKLMSEFTDKGIKKGVVLAAIKVLKSRGVLKEYQMGKIFRRMK
jgi:DNA replication licensing factor MCM5